MATVVGIMDQRGWDACTDVIVIVDPTRRRLLWIPRDLWCECLGDRINTAFRTGGHDALMRALREHRIAVQHSVCVRRELTDRALEHVRVRVTIESTMSFWYPLAPCRPIEEGRKLVTFRPPAEVLSGERVHQWLGARYEVPSRPRRTEQIRERCRRLRARFAGPPYWPPGVLPDLDRIARQQVFVKSLLDTGFDFARVLDNPEWVSLSDPRALDDARDVRGTWKFATFDDVVARPVGAKKVLVSRVPPVTP